MEHPTKPRRHRRILTSILVAPCLLLASCFTSLLWGTNLLESSDRDAYVSEASYDRDEGDHDNGLAIWEKLLLTPASLLLDLLTSPLQIWLFSREEHEEKHESKHGSKHHHHGKHHRH